MGPALNPHLGRRRSPIVAAEFKADSSKGRLEAYASTFGNRDHHADIVVRGAFSKTIQERFPAGLIYPLFGHDPGQLLGKVEHLEEDQRGLFTVTTATNELGRRVLADVEAGALRYMSIGFDSVVEEPQTDPEGRATGATLLKELRLYEYSVVLWPANEQATVSAVKALEESFGPLWARLADITDAVGSRERLSRGEQQFLSETRRLISQSEAELSRIKALLSLEPEPRATTPEPMEPPPGEPEPQLGELHSLLARVKEEAEGFSTLLRLRHLHH